MKKKQTKKPRIRLALGMPSSGQARIDTLRAIVDMVVALKDEPGLNIEDIKLFDFSSSVIPKNRHMIIDEAQKWGATHILWVDEDMHFPPMAAISLLYTMLDNPEKYQVLGANCVKRQYPIAWMARDMEGRELSSYGKQGIQEVLYTGNAFILMNMELFTKIKKPWFAFGWNDVVEDFGTEDTFFQHKVRKELGVNTYIDHEVSQLLDHIGAWYFRPQHWVDKKDLEADVVKIQESA